MFDIYDLISKSGLDNVRWDSVKHFKLILTNGVFLYPLIRSLRG